jgi:hypothetical protein
MTYTHIHTYTHTHIHTYTHTHIHTYTHTHIHTYTHAHIHTYTHTQTRVPTQCPPQTWLRETAGRASGTAARTTSPCPHVGSSRYVRAFPHHHPTCVSLLPRKGVCPASRSNARMHSFSAKRLLLISAPSRRVYRSASPVSAARSLPARCHTHAHTHAHTAHPRDVTHGCHSQGHKCSKRCCPPPHTHTMSTHVAAHRHALRGHGRERGPPAHAPPNSTVHASATCKVNKACLADKAPRALVTDAQLQHCMGPGGVRVHLASAKRSQQYVPAWGHGLS